MSYYPFLSDAAGNSGSNIYLRDGTLVTIGTGADVPAPQSGMIIGVTTENEPELGEYITLTTNGQIGDELFITSDDSEYCIVFDGVVKLVNLAPPAPEEAAEGVSVYVDDELLTEGKDYNWVNGKVVLTAEFLETLEEGEHELKVVFPGFTVKESFSFTDGAVVPAEDAKYLTV